MQLTINIKEEEKSSFFINLLQELDFIEILDINEDEEFFPKEHKILLEERLEKIVSGKTKFNNWDVIKKRYENRAI